MDGLNIPGLVDSECKPQKQPSASNENIFAPPPGCKKKNEGPFGMKHKLQYCKMTISNTTFYVLFTLYIVILLVLIGIDIYLKNKN